MSVMPDRMQNEPSAYELQKAIDLIDKGFRITIAALVEGARKDDLHREQIDLLKDEQEKYRQAWSRNLTEQFAALEVRHKKEIAALRQQVDDLKGQRDSMMKSTSPANMPFRVRRYDTSYAYVTNEGDARMLAQRVALGIAATNSPVVVEKWFSEGIKWKPFGEAWVEADGFVQFKSMEITQP